LERPENREVVSDFRFFGVWGTSFIRTGKSFAVCVKHFCLSTLGETLENFACGKEKFGEFFGENFPLLISCEKICEKNTNFFQFFCIAMKQNRRSCFVWIWGLVEKTPNFPTCKKKSCPRRFEFSTMFSTLCGKLFSRKSKFFPRLPFLLEAGKENQLFYRN
jgi:hypothetical protein